MKLIAITLTAAGVLAAAGSAAAASDVDYLRASRCRGLAASGVAAVDTAARRLPPMALPCSPLASMHSSVNWLKERTTMAPAWVRQDSQTV